MMYPFNYLHSIETMNQALKVGSEEAYTSLSFPFQVAISYNSKCKGEIYRGRLLPEDECQDKIPISKLSYPDPKQYKIPRGRCNIEGVPVFYCGTFAGALLETIATKNDNNSRILLSEWACPETDVILFDTSVRITEKTVFNNRNYTPANGERRLMNSYLDTFERCFTSVNGYPFTSKYSDLLLYGKKRPFDCSMIKYPSIVPIHRFNKSAKHVLSNYAIATHFFDRHYKFQLVYEIEVFQTIETILSEGEFRFDTVRVGFPDSDGYVAWAKETILGMPVTLKLAAL